jgi:cyanophycinase
MNTKPILLLLLVLLTTNIRASAQADAGLLIPMGGGYSDVYSGFSQAAVANARNGQVNILVLAPTYSTNAITITEAERQTNLKDAEERRYQIEEACKRAASTQTCKATLVPIFTRADAEDSANLAYFNDEIAAIFILGGDQTVAMQILVNTPIEARISELHQSGTILAGTSAGGGMQSRAMLAGYNLNYAAENSLSFGAADVWNAPEKRGLDSSLQSAIFDQHFHQRARMGRLLNAILQPGVPHVGIGVDAYTGAIIEGEILGNVFGLYTVTILDAETYHASDSVSYVSVDAQLPPLLSARNILVNLLSPGGSSYNLSTRQNSLAVPAESIEREFSSLAAPEGAGTLILAGDISETLNENLILARFKEIAGENILIVAVGYSNERSATNALNDYSEALGGGTQVVAGDDPLVIPAETTGILLIGKDQSKVRVEALNSLREFWLAGKPILAANAAAPILGSFYSAHEPTPNESEDAEIAVQKSFLLGKTNIQSGLGLLDITLEPQLLADNRFGRWFSLAYNHPQLPAVGLNQNTAIEVTSQGATVLGKNSILVLDLSRADLAVGSQNGFVIANGLLDIFAPGDLVQPQPADVNTVFTPQATPLLPTAEVTFEPTVNATVTLPTISTPEVSAETPDTKSPANETTSYLPAWSIALIVLVLSGIIWLILRKK